LSGSLLSPANEITLLRSIVDWGEPIKKGLTRFMIFSIILALVPSLDASLRRQRYLAAQIPFRKVHIHGEWDNYLDSLAWNAFKRVMLATMRLRSSLTSSGSHFNLFHAFLPKGLRLEPKS
jgi:hypothetical protein